MGFIVGFIIVVIIGIIIKLSAAKQRIATINNNVELQEDIIKTNGITVSNDAWYRTALGRIYWRYIVDDQAHKIHFVDINNNLYTLPFEKIIGCDLLEDNQVSGQISRAIAGGLIAGGAGAIVGSSTAKQKVSSLILRINQDDLSMPAISMQLIDMPQERTYVDYKNASAYANFVLESLKVILHRQEATGNPSQPVSKSQESLPKPSDRFEEIKQYKQLLDMGIISQEEFEEKKKELLFGQVNISPSSSPAKDEDAVVTASPEKEEETSFDMIVIEAVNYIKNKVLVKGIVQAGKVSANDHIELVRNGETIRNLIVITVTTPKTNSAGDTLVGLVFEYENPQKVDFIKGDRIIKR